MYRNTLPEACPGVKNEGSKDKKALICRYTK